MNLDKDLYISDSHKQDDSCIQSSKCILVYILEEHRCNLVSKSMLDFRIWFDRENSDHMAMDCKMVVVQSMEYLELYNGYFILNSSIFLIK